MTAHASLTAEPRTGRGKSAARKLRAAGRVPAVVYGRHEEVRHVSLDHRQLENLISHVQVENTIIDLRIGRGRAIQALVREVQMHPYRPEIHHVDFYVLHANEPVELEVPIRLTGTAEGVKAGGVLQQTLHDLPVRCLPNAIPEAIEADVSSLQIGESLHVSDLAIPDGVTVEVEGDRTVCSVQPPVTAPAEPPPPLAPEGVGGEVEPELLRKRAEDLE